MCEYLEFIYMLGMDDLIIKQLVDEYKFYQSKLKNIEAVCSKYSVILNSIVKPKILEHGIIDDTIDVDKNVDNTSSDVTNNKVEEKVKSKEIKKIFKKIAKLIHPDVSKADISNYQNAQKMYDDNDIFGLKVIAYDLGIDSDVDYMEIKNKIYELDVITKNKMNTYEWLYANTISEKEKEQIILEYTSKIIS